MPSTPLNDERDSILNCDDRQPHRSEAAGTGSHASVSDQRDVGVLERRLAGGDPADRACRRASPSSACVSSSPAGDWTSSTCACSRSSIDTEVTPRRRAQRARPSSSSTPNVSISTTVRSATIAFRSRGVPSATICALVDHGDPVAEVVRLEHVVGRQQHRLARLGRATAIVARSSRAPTGSTPIVGSSRKTTGGSWRSPRAMCSRWRMPRE